MTKPLNLILRNWRYFWASHLALIAGAMIASAVITGALLVGDSVKYSLAQRALDRLGPVDYALVAPLPLNESVPERLARNTDYDFAPPAFGLQLSGGVESNNAVSARVSLRALVGNSDVELNPTQGALNGELAALLGAKPGDELTASLPRIASMPADAAFARRSFEDIIGALSAKITVIHNQRDFADLFSLEGGQRAPRNAWFNLRDLQRAADLSQKINLILIHDPSNRNPKTGAEKLDRLLQQTLTLADYGLSIDLDQNTAILNSTTTFIPTPILNAVETAAKKAHIKVDPVSVYLANTLQTDSGKSIHYAMMASVQSLGLAGDDIALNQWAADQLGAQLGDSLTLDYYKRDASGNLVDTKHPRKFTLKRILPMEGLGADPSLVPAYKGLTDAKAVKQWDPPEGLVIKDEWVTPDDETYWETHKAAPKIFVSFETAKELWGRSFGEVNSVRFSAADAQAFQTALIREISPQKAGLAFVPIKALQLQSAVSGTDFSGLFIGFSFFLIASALLLISLLFKLQIQRRARQLGLLNAMGFSPARIVKLTLLESLLPSILGGLLGIALGVGFTAWMIHELSSRWIAAIGSDALRLYITPLSLILGFFIAFLVSMLVITLSALKIRTQRPATLLAGVWIDKHPGKRRNLNIALLLIALASLALILLGDILALVGGGLLLVGLLVGLWSFVRSSQRRDNRVKNLLSLGLVNAARKPSRTLLSASLIALACFTLVATSAFQRQNKINELDRPSGTGGFQLLLRADLPLLGDLQTPQGRKILGIIDLENPLWNQCEFLSLRAKEGQDASCLNMTQPTQPTLIALPPKIYNGTQFTGERGVLDTLVVLNNAVGEAESMQYILKLPVGGQLPLVDQLGQQQKLTLSAVLHNSIFQSELLVSEETFLKLFPGQSGFSRVLVRTPAGKEEQTRNLLRKELKDYSVEIRSTSAIIEEFHSVANAYLKAFELLGSLGLLLGALGLSTLLLQSLLEQRAELSLMGALGFSKLKRFVLVFAQNALPLVLGIAIGTASAAAGVWPAIARRENPADLEGILLKLLLVALAGFLSIALPLLFASRKVGWGDLRRE